MITNLLIIGFICWQILFFIGKKLGFNCLLPSFKRGGGRGGGSSTTSHTYYYYKIKAPHNNIDPSQPILYYDSYGVLVNSLPPYSTLADYGNGTYSVPGVEQNLVIESIATASYYVFYSTSDVVIDYDKAEIKISKNLIRSLASTSVQGTFEYLSVITPFKDIASVIDGRWDTQVQTVFFAEPPTGYNYSILDLGSAQEIQAIDIVAGFYKPDDIRKFDIDFNVTMKYSLDGTNYYDVSDKTNNVQFTGGVGKSFEESDLGIGFTARYLKFVLENVKKIEYGTITAVVSDANRQTLIDQGVATSSTANGTTVIIRAGTYVVAVTEISAYNNITLKSQAKLIPTTTLTSNIDLTALSSGEYPTTLNVVSTEGFDASGSGYILNDDGTADSFNYTSKTTTSFTISSGLSDNHLIGDYVVQELEGDTSVYDYDSLLPKLKDRVYKSNKVNDDMLFSEAQSNYVAKEFLKEFIKNHTKIQVNVLYSPHIEVGQTLTVIDTYNNTNTRYFVDSLSDNNGYYSLVLARYPS